MKYSLSYFIMGFVFRRFVTRQVLTPLNLEYFSMDLGFVIQNFMRIKIDYMIKILMEAAMRASKQVENFNIFLIHSV